MQHLFNTEILNPDLKDTTKVSEKEVTRKDSR